MNRKDLLNLVGHTTNQSADYVPVACLLKSGYACVGYFNSIVNSELDETLVLLNMRLVDLRPEEAGARRARVSDFSDFLEETVVRHIEHKEPAEDSGSGSTIPLTAIPLQEIAILYPVAHIATLLRHAHREAGNSTQSNSGVSGFLDFNNRSIVLKVLRTKLW
ncbi:MAG: hypothetical protein JNM43_24605 [Planctomycetaceae bacterium]|nr:hypothetical protein [Planctomycetaceae bacterium]